MIGWSEKTGIEMFKYGDHMMGIQGHPEYTMDILFHLIDRLVQHNLIMVCSPSDRYEINFIGYDINFIDLWTSLVQRFDLTFQIVNSRNKSFC